MRKVFLIIFVSLTAIQLVIYSLDAFGHILTLPHHFDVMGALFVPGFLIYLFAPFNPAEMSIGHPFLGILFSLPPIFLNSVLYASIVIGIMRLVSRLRKRARS